MKTVIAWRYRTKIGLAPKRGYASCESKKCLPKGRQRAFHLLLKVSRIEEMLEAPRAGGPVRVGLCRDSTPVRGVGGSRERRGILLELFSLFFPLNKHVKTRV